MYKRQFENLAAIGLSGSSAKINSYFLEKIYHYWSSVYLENNLDANMIQTQKIGITKK